MDTDKKAIALGRLLDRKVPPRLNIARDKEVYDHNERSPLDPDPGKVPGSYHNGRAAAYVKE